MHQLPLRLHTLHVEVGHLCFCTSCSQLSTLCFLHSSAQFAVCSWRFLLLLCATELFATRLFLSMVWAFVAGIVCAEDPFTLCSWWAGSFLVSVPNRFSCCRVSLMPWRPRSSARTCCTMYWLNDDSDCVCRHSAWIARMRCRDECLARWRIPSTEWHSFCRIHSQSATRVDGHRQAGHWSIFKLTLHAVGHRRFSKSVSKVKLSWSGIKRWTSLFCVFLIIWKLPMPMFLATDPADSL